MAQRRLDLQTLLESILGSSNVYFQPPPSYQMAYPCIVYQRIGLNTMRADNTGYTTRMEYQITIIDKDPDSDIPRKIAALPLCSFNRFFTTEYLNHDVYKLFF